MKRLLGVVVCLIVLLAAFGNIGFAAEMKKAVILHTSRTTSMAQEALASLEEGGFIEQQNLLTTWIEVSAATDPVQLVAQVKAATPDVALCITGFGHVIDVLEQFPAPVITMTAVEPFVDAGGVPTANVTGVYTKLDDMLYNSYKFLQKVAPLKAGQQVVFLENKELSMLISRDEVVDALERLQIPLKTVIDTAAIYEDWQEAILKYNDDPEVGWILQGSGPTSKRDGSSVDARKDIYPWQRNHLKKPSLSHLGSAVQAGVLCGFGIDLYEVGAQCGDMAVRVLQGESISTITAEYPQVTIALNRKTATNIGIIFPLDVLNLANVIYDDYEGKQVIRK